MRNTVYFCVILCFILHNVKSNKPDQTRFELKHDPKKTQHAGEKFDISKFVDVLLRDAKKIDQKHKKSGKRLRRTTEKTKTKPKTVDEGFESSYDSLGLDDNTKVQILRTNSPGIDLVKMGQILRSNNQGLGYKKIGQILRSNAGPYDNKMEAGVLRSFDRPSDEEGAELLFDLEDEDGLKNPLF